MINFSQSAIKETIKVSFDRIRNSTAPHIKASSVRTRNSVPDYWSILNICEPTLSPQVWTRCRCKSDEPFLLTD